MPVIRTFSIRVEPLAWLLFAGLLVLVVGVSTFRWLDHDELESLQAAWKIYDGEKIYVDFYQIHHPFHYYALYPLFAIYGSSLEVVGAARIFILFQLFAIYGIVYLLALELCDRTTAAVGVFFLAAFTLFTQAGIEVRPDVPMTLSGLAGVYLLFRYLRLRRLWLLVASGLCLCLSFLFLQKAAILILLLGAVMGLRFLQRDVSLREILIFGGTMLLGLVPYAAYLWLDGSLSEFIFFNYIFTRSHHALTGMQKRVLLENIPRVVGNGGIAFLLFFYSLLRVPLDRRQREVAFLGIGWFAWVLFVGRHWPQYYLPGLPFIAIIGARGLGPLLAGRPRLLLLALLFTFAMPAASYTRHILNGREDQMARFEYVHAVTEPGDYVYDGRLEFNLFRKDPDFFYSEVEPHRGFIKTMERLRGYHFDAYALIERYKPKVISDVGIDVEDPRIAEFYEPVPGIPRMYVRHRQDAGGRMHGQEAASGRRGGAL